LRQGGMGFVVLGVQGRQNRPARSRRGPSRNLICHARIAG
jgi:hypothetical protein